MNQKHLKFCIAFIMLVLSSHFGHAQKFPDVDPNSTVKIGKIYILGNKKTRDEIILRELDFNEGDSLHVSEFAEKLQLDQQKITNTRLFVLVEVNPLFLSENEADVLIRVQERWYVFPIPIFKLADRNFTEWWVNQNRDFSRVNYGLQVNHTNLTGRNDRLRVRAQFGFTQIYSALYSVPYVNKEQTIGFAFSSSYSTAKTVSYSSSSHRQVFVEGDEILRRTTSINASMTYRPSFFTRHSFSLGYSGVNVEDTLSLLNNNYLSVNDGSQQVLRFTYTFSVDKRDYVAYPLTGSTFRAQISQIGLGLFNDLNMLTGRITYSKFSKVKERFFWANRLELYRNFANDIPYATRVGFGYRPDFVRGYERFVIESDMLLSIRSAMRFKLVEGMKEINRKSMIDQFRSLPYALYLKVFTDLGYSGDPMLSTQNNFFNNEWIGSVGIGLDIVTYYDFVMRFEYSINRQGNTGFFFNFRSAF